VLLDASAAGAEPSASADDSWGWLVTFSDLVLQLFAFMVVAALARGAQPAAPELAFGAATVEAAVSAAEPDPAPAAAGEVAVPPGEAGEQLGADDIPAPHAVPAPDAAPHAEAPSEAPRPASEPVALGAPAPRAPGDVAAERRLAALHGYVDNLVAVQVPQGGVTVRAADGELVVTIGDVAGFAPGSAEPLPAMQPLLDELRTLVRLAPHLQVEVSGHTDDRPIRTTRFPSNLELSLARAAQVAHVLGGGDASLARRIFASGHAERKPVAPNEDAAGRARNRRVEIRLVAREAAP
jgi:flagellar motor protein MotB